MAVCWKESENPEICRLFPLTIQHMHVRKLLEVGEEPTCYKEKNQSVDMRPEDKITRQGHKNFVIMAFRMFKKLEEEFEHVKQGNERCKKDPSSITISEIQN